MEKELPLIESRIDASVDACGCGHDHGPEHHHHHHDEATLSEEEQTSFENLFLDVAYAFSERFGDRSPSPQEEKDFMREWLTNNGRSTEEADAILNS